MDQDNVAIRLKHFLNVKDLSPSVFADTCGIARPTLSQLMNGRNKKVSNVLVRQMHEAYPDLSIIWLLFGEGPMLIPVSPQASMGGSVGSNFTVNEKNPDENLNFTDDTADRFDFRKENDSQNDDSPAQMPENSGIYGYKRGDFIAQDFVPNRGKPRSVVRITVFYDDNSYESFEPSNKS